MAKLMLVEDDNNLREIYEARLQAEGYEIVTAMDGEEALVVAKAEQPDLVISDVMMPKISGFEMLDILRNTDGLKDVKVIMLTALGQNDDQQRADKLGADRYLVKSQVTLEDIVKVTHELLDGNSAAPAAAPVAAAAAPDPAPAPTAEPVPVAEAPAITPAEEAPVPEPAAAAAVEEVASQSTAQEEAAVEANIENFVAGATEDPSAPAEAEPSLQPAPEEPAVPEVTTPETPAPDPTAAAPAATVDSDSADSTATDDTASATPDDQLIADATEKLVASATVGTAPVIITPTVDPAPDPPAAEPEAPAAPPSDSPKTGGERVIQPVESAPKKDINVLLAQEEANQSPGQIVPVVDGSQVQSDSAVSPAPPNSDDQNKPVDPNSIAL